MNAIERLWEGIKALFEQERAVPWSDIVAQVQTRIGEAYPDEYVWLNDLYHDNGQMFAVMSKGGKLFRVSVMLDGTEVTLGAAQEVETQFSPVSAFRVMRQADGRRRWFAIAATAVLNRVGEIDSRSLFDSFVANTAEHGYPELRFYHDSRLRIGEADWVARDDNVYMASGLLDVDNPLADALADAIESGRGQWGNSIGYQPLCEPEMCRVADGVTIPTYTAGVNREISVLPEARAASWFTALDLEVNRMRKDVETALRQLFGDEELASAFIEQVDGTNRSIADDGLVTREVEEVPVVEEEIVEPEAQELVVDDETLKRIAELVKVDRVDLSEIEKSLAAIIKRLDALETNEDEKRQRWQADLPARKQTEVTYRPREANREAVAPMSLADAAEAILNKSR